MLQENRSKETAAPVEDLLPTERTISAVVHAFYDRIRQDDLLAPIFNPRLEGHWDEHLATMVDFWSSVLLSSGRYQGRPLALHGQLGELTPEMWERWLQLFAETACEQCPTSVAALFIERSRQIASHLSRSLATQRGGAATLQSRAL